MSSKVKAAVCLEIPAKLAESDVRRSFPGPSVKQLVRNLSNRYASAASSSPLLSKKKKIGRNHGSASLKTMKTTAATSVLPLTPSFTSRRQTLQGKTAVHIVKIASDSEAGSPKCASKECFSRTPPAGVQRVGTSVLTPSHLHNISFNSKKPTPVQKQLVERANGQSLLSEKHSQRSSAGRPASVSRVVRSDQKFAGLKKTSELEFESPFTIKDEELENIRTDGLRLKELCLKQGEEINMLKAATLKETDQLRELCEKQGKELMQARVAIPLLQDQVSVLAEQLKCLAEDVDQLKFCFQARPKENSLQLHTSSNCSASTLSMEPSPNLAESDHVRRSRKGLNTVRLSHEKLPHAILTPCIDQEKVSNSAGAHEAASSWSGSTVTIDQSELLSDNKTSIGRHRRGLSGLISGDYMLKGGGRSGRHSLTDTEITETLQELNNVAEKEQAMLQERCANVFKDLRSQSSRFASLESLKSILTCTSPHIFKDAQENEVMDISTKLGKMAVDMWNLKPT